MTPISTLPHITVELDGRPLHEEDIQSLGKVRIQQRLSMPTLCELSFFESAGPLGDASLQPAGSSLRIAVRGNNIPLFTGQVTAVEYAYDSSRGRVVHVRGYDLLHQLRKRQEVRVFVQMTPADLARELVADLGIKVSESVSDPLWQRIVQHRQSDLDLLVEVTERSGQFITLRGDVLHVMTLDGIGDEIPLMLGESLMEARIEINGDPSCRSVTTSGWDPWRVEHHEGQVKTARVGRKVAVNVPPDRFGSDGERIVVDEVIQDDGQAEAISQAELDLRITREVIFRGVAEGDPHLRPGTPVAVQGVAKAFEGRYILTGVNHIIDNEKGFVSEIFTSPPAPKAHDRSAVAAFGIVTQVDDPENMGRVRVSLPTYQDIETDWISVLIPGAGEGKGLVMLPDVEDRVLVLLIHGDPAQGVILGGLYGTNRPPDWGIEGGSIKRYTFLTPDGQKLTLDDADNTVRLDNGKGSFLKLSPGKVLLHSEVNLEIEAPGRSIVIRGQSIDFERG
jgi:phage baseplate assembly protein gpV/phage protein D